MVDRNKGRKWLVHLSADDWWRSNPHSRYHFTEQFYLAGYSVIWVNPLGLRFPSIRKQYFLRKILSKVKSILVWSRKIKPDFYVLSPVFVPLYKKGFAERLNTTLVYGQLRLLCKAVKAKQLNLFVTLPSFAPLVRRLQARKLAGKVIYYYSDLYNEYREIRDRETINAWDQELQASADSIYCASKTILKSIPEEIRSRKIVRVVDHQVDFDRFDYLKLQPSPLSIPRPIIGYFGTLTDSNDWDMIEYAALSKPEWSFVFVGRKLIDLPNLKHLSNIHFLGFIGYERLPSVAVNFSIGIMFWKMTPWIKACSPLKLKEYLALGLPVVSVPIEEVATKYREYVEIATDGPTFVEAVGRCVGKAPMRSHRDFASQFSWERAAKQIISESL